MTDMNIDIVRHHILKNMRDCLYQEGYIEVVSSIIRNSNSKINPRFKLANDKFLRDCMELPLRKKVSVICPKVFEIGPSFRQEEDNIHQKEFYLMELYAKNGSLKDMFRIMRKIIVVCIPSACSAEEISVRKVISDDLGVDIAIKDTQFLVDEIKKKYSHIETNQYPHKTVNRYIELKIEPMMKNKDCLYFLTEYPLCTIAVAKRKRTFNYIQRFECFINNLEIANAFEDCTDTDDLQSRLNQSGIMSEEEKELIELTKNNQILPTAGLGIGIERLCMLVLNRERK